MTDEQGLSVGVPHTPGIRLVDAPRDEETMGYLYCCALAWKAVMTNVLTGNAWTGRLEESEILLLHGDGRIVTESEIKLLPGDVQAQWGALMWGASASGRQIDSNYTTPERAAEWVRRTAASTWQHVWQARRHYRGMYYDAWTAVRSETQRRLPSPE